MSISKNNYAARILICALTVALASAVMCTAAFAARDTLIVVDQYDPTTMDPIGHSDMPSARVCDALYDTLIWRDDATKELRPRLAEKWEFLSDTEYKFYLRKGVKFHDGNEMKAEDVRYSIMRATTEKGAKINTYSRNVDYVEVVDDYTVIIHLKSADYSFFTSLIHCWSAVVSKEACEAAGDDFGIKPVGCGPFKFVSWQKNDRYVLERFDDYWGEKPKFKRLEVRSVPEGTSRTIELESGGADIAYPVSQVDFARIESNEKLSLHREPQLSTTFMGFNCIKAPFNDVRVRRAILAALDTTEIQAAVWNGVGKVPTTAVPGMVAYSVQSEVSAPKRDVELAKKLLAEAGIKEGTVMQIWTNERKERQDMATIIQAQLDEVGIHTEIKVLEWGAYLNGLREKTHDMYILGWSGGIPDANFSIGGILEGGAGSNYMYLDDPVLNELLVKGRATQDGPERGAVYRDAQLRVNEIVPMILLHNDESVAGMQKYVRGFAPKFNEIHTFRNTYFEE